jgi:hypothetical protein
VDLGAECSPSVELLEVAARVGGPDAWVWGSWDVEDTIVWYLARSLAGAGDGTRDEARQADTDDPLAPEVDRAGRRWRIGAGVIPVTPKSPGGDALAALTEALPRPDESAVGFMARSPLCGPLAAERAVTGGFATGSMDPRRGDRANRRPGDPWGLGLRRAQARRCERTGSRAGPDRSLTEGRLAQPRTARAGDSTTGRATRICPLRAGRPT